MSINRTLHALAMFLLPLCTWAQEQVTLDTWARNLLIFGKSVPQEEIFVHMDNTSYYVGDTIYYKVYSRLSTGEPSKLSGLMYVELLNNDGFLVERENIKMTNGHGHGCFVLSDSLYSGYFELRAYTRWQLNWGITEHYNSYQTKNWFYSKRMHDEHFRDYDKLYSRVFPVYDKPREDGNYSRNITPRPLRRYFKIKYEKPQADLTFYPEGGNLVAGAKCRVAFEANDTDGKHLKGKLAVKDSKGNVVAEANTLNRGRGCFEIDVVSKEKYTAEFTWGENNTSSSKLPQSEEEGCAIHVNNDGQKVSITLQNRGLAATEPLAYTVMSHGVLKVFQKLEPGENAQAEIDLSKVPDGVAQITVFNASGRVWADRMFFVRHPDFKHQTLQLSGLKDDDYKPFEHINLGIEGIPGATVSVAVRDEVNSEYTFDSGNILTEMLLSSQIKGFVEQPEYYFEADDEEHRNALDLLLMIQGWRRYKWELMATPGLFNAHEPYERTPWIYGEVNQIPNEDRLDLFQEPSRVGFDSNPENPDYIEMVNTYPSCAMYFSPDFVKKWHGLAGAKAAANILYFKLGKPDSGMVNSYEETIRRMLVAQFAMDIDKEKMPMGNLKHDVTVHAEFVTGRKVTQGESAVVGDVMTFDKGQFRIEAPAIDGYCYFFCTASDQTKWKDGKEPKWIEFSEEKYDGDGMNGQINYPEFYVRLREPYPRWVKPYSFYQTCQNESPRRLNNRLVSVDDATLMREVTIGANYNGLKTIDLTKPAMVIDAYDAFNATIDAGLCAGYYGGAGKFMMDVEKVYIGDMGMEANLFEPTRGKYNTRFNGGNLSSNITPYEMAKYSHLHFLDKVYIYTDYSPRREGDKRFQASDQPEVTINLVRREDNTMFVTYRDRRKILWGYSNCADYYHRDYSGVATPDAKDYRRTLYWNPDIVLDDNGKAEISFWNNSRSKSLSISAEGMGTKGELLSVER